MNNKDYWHKAFEESAGKNSTSARSSFFSDANTMALHYEIRRLVGQPEGKVIMDVGCGDGSLLKHLAQSNRVIGLDYSQSMLEHVAENGLEPLCADFENIPLSAQSCDIIVSVEALTLANEPYLCIARLMDLLAPGGSLILSILNNRSVIRTLVSPFFRFFVKQLPTPLSPAEVCRVIRQNNGEVVKSATTLMLPGKSLIRDTNVDSASLYLGNNFIIKAVKH